MSLKRLNMKLPDGWSERKIEDVTSKVGSGATPRGGKSVYLDDGTPLIRSQNVYDHHFAREGLAFIAADAAKKLKNVELKKGDVLLNITGDSILRCCSMPDEYIGGRVNQHVAILRANDNILPGFLQKWISLPAMKELMLGFSAGGTRKTVTKGQILGFPIAVPPLDEQQAIAATLGALDDKIESNMRAIKTIDDLVLAEFSDFSSSARGEFGRLDSFFSVTIGRTPPRKEAEWFTLPSRESMKWVSIKDMGAATTFLTETSEALTSKAVLNHRVPVSDPGDVLVSFKLTVGRVAMCGEPMCTNEAIATIHIGDPAIREYTYAFLKSFDYRTLGSTSSIATAVNSKTIKAIRFFKPERKCLDAFHSKVAPLFKLSKQREYETRSLRELRDTLLPELMSGRIRVSEAKDVVQDATDTDLPEVRDV